MPMSTAGKGKLGRAHAFFLDKPARPAPYTPLDMLMHDPTWFGYLGFFTLSVCHRLGLLL